MKDIYVIDGETTTQQFAKDIDDNFKELKNLTGSSNGASVTDVTYDELVVLISTSGLTQGTYYKITDFQTAHFIKEETNYIDDGNGGSVKNICDIEPLIVFATMTNALSKNAFSTLFPQDIIHYDWNPDNWKDDTSFAEWVDINSSWELVIMPEFKGVIHFRHDTKNDNSAGYDFRNVKFRRWEVADNPWNSGTTYSVGNTVVDTGGIYVSIMNGNLNHSLTSTSWWGLINDLTITRYLNTSSSSNLVDSTSNYKDVLTFVPFENPTDVDYGIYDSCCFHNHIAPYKETTYNQYYSDTMLTNSVFYIPDERTKCIHSNTIGEGFISNTLMGWCFGNNIGKWFNYNIVGTDFFCNTIKNDASINYIGSDFNGNDLGHEFHWNTIGKYFKNNYCGYDLFSNTIGGAVYENIFGNRLTSNKFGYSIFSNTIGCDFASNFITNSQRNQFGNNISYLNFSGNSSNNIIGNNMMYVYLYTGTTLTNNFFKGNSRYMYFSTGATSGLTTYRCNTFDFNLTGLTYFSGSTLLFSNYDTDVIRRVDGTYRVRYIDNNDATIIASITT